MKIIFVVLLLLTFSGCTAYDELQRQVPDSSQKRIKGMQKKPATPVNKHLAV